MSNYIGELYENQTFVSMFEKALGTNVGLTGKARAFYSINTCAKGTDFIIHSCILLTHILTVLEYSRSQTKVSSLAQAQVSLQLGKVFSSDNGVSVSIMYSYMH